MANTKISQLPQNNNPTGGEELVYAYNNSNGKMTLNTMKTFSNTGQQAELVSGVNIKTINGMSILGSGNIDVEGGEPTYDYSAMQGPCTTGFHIPMESEWTAIKAVWTGLGGTANDGESFSEAVKLPFAGNRAYASGNTGNQGNNGKYRSVTADGTLVSSLYIASGSFNTTNGQQRAMGFPIRAIKDEPVVPDAGWTMTYGVSIQDGGIFWSSADGLISMSADGDTWITISDKNEGATSVWNSGDALAESNCGKYYQRGNNYGFDWTGTITTSSTQVNASTYGPGNYYTGSSFIKGSADWSSVQNDNLWGGVTGPVPSGVGVSIVELGGDANIWELEEGIYATNYDLYYISGSKVSVYGSTHRQMLFVSKDTSGGKGYLVYNVGDNGVYVYPRAAYGHSKTSSEGSVHMIREWDASLKEYGIATGQTVAIEAIGSGSGVGITQLVENMDGTDPSDATLSVDGTLYSGVTYTVIINSVDQNYTIALGTGVTNPLNIALPSNSNKKCIITMVATSSSTAIVSGCTIGA